MRRLCLCVKRATGMLSKKVWDNEAALQTRPCNEWRYNRVGVFRGHSRTQEGSIRRGEDL